jgi:hypothetical protein
MPPPMPISYHDYGLSRTIGRSLPCWLTAWWTPGPYPCSSHSTTSSTRRVSCTRAPGEAEPGCKPGSARLPYHLVLQCCNPRAVPTPPARWYRYRAPPVRYAAGTGDGKAYGRSFLYSDSIDDVNSRPCNKPTETSSTWPLVFSTSVRAISAVAVSFIPFSYVYRVAGGVRVRRPSTARAAKSMVMQSPHSEALTPIRVA